MVNKPIYLVIYVYISMYVRKRASKAEWHPRNLKISLILWWYSSRPRLSAPTDECQASDMQTINRSITLLLRILVHFTLLTKQMITQTYRKVTRNFTIQPIILILWKRKKEWHGHRCSLVHTVSKGIIHHQIIY